MRLQTSLPHVKPTSGNRALLYGGVSTLILIVIAATLVTLMQLRHEAEIRVEITTQSLAKSIEQTVSGIIDTIDIALLASSNEIQRQMSAGKVDGAEITHMLIEQRKHIPAVAHFRATNERGDIIYGPDIPSPPTNTADRDHFIQLRDNPDKTLAVDKPFFGRISKKWVWTFARRIEKPDGSFGGVTFAAISIDEINKMLAQIEIEPGRSISLRTGTLELVTRYPSSSLALFPIGEKRLSSTFLDTFKVNPQKGTYSSGSSTSVDGLDRTYSYHRNEKYGFIVNVGIDNDTAFAEWRKQAWAVGILAAIFSLALLAFTRLIINSWLRQEEALATLKESQQIAQLGEYWIDLRTGTWISSTILDEIVGIDSSYPRDAEHWKKLAAPEMREERQAYTNAILEQRRSFDFEYRIIRPKDGIERWVQSKGKLQFSEDETPFALVGTIQDITERKNAEVNLRIAATAFDSQEAMVITDADSVILRVNHAFTENTGYTADEVIGKTPRILRSGRHDAKFFENMWKMELGLKM